MTFENVAIKAADALLGQCLKDLSDVLNDLGRPELENDTAFLAMIDERVFNCVSCGWWCSQDECNESPLGEWVCDECKEHCYD